MFNGYEQKLSVKKTFYFSRVFPLFLVEEKNWQGYKKIYR
jgi:hypothetical protein